MIDIIGFGIWEFLMVQKYENVYKGKNLRDLCKYCYLCRKSFKLMSKINIRAIKKNEIGILEDLLYEAIFQPDTNNPIPRSILQVPEIKVYIKGFGNRKDDFCFVADLDGKIVGAVWVRIIFGEIKGYGNVDDTTPEFSISLFKEYRNKGIGNRLMKKMIEHLKKKGYKQTSLSVQKANYAVKLYRKMGFDVIRDENEEYIMVLKLG